jgi:putative membrane protein
MACRKTSNGPKHAIQGGIEMMRGYGGGAGGVFIWLLMLLFVAAIVVGVVLLVRGSSRGSVGGSQAMTPGSSGPTPPPSSPALQILEERYARGDIDREEFLQRKQDLLAGR